MQVLSANNGVVLVGAQPPDHPARLLLVLDFPRETIELSLHELIIDRGHPAYNRTMEANLFQFLKDLFSNGILEIYNSVTGERLSHKTAFIPENIDLPSTLHNFQQKIDALLESNP